MEQMVNSTARAINSVDIGTIRYGFIRSCSGKIYWASEYGEWTLAFPLFKDRTLGDADLDFSTRAAIGESVDVISWKDLGISDFREWAIANGQYLPESR